jgi:hypothetical protein
MGIDPAENLAEEQEKRGIYTYRALFNKETAYDIYMACGSANIITASNCMAHTAKLASFLSGINELLCPGGVAIVEVPYAVDLIEKNLFDSIYHEHISYFHFTPLNTWIGTYDLYIQDVEHDEVHGGTMRLTLGRLKDRHNLPPTKAIEEWIERENDLKSCSINHWKKLATQLDGIKERFIHELQKNRSQGKVVAGWAASAKASVFLNYCGVGEELISYIADSNTLKQGKCIPGVRIPIYSEEELASIKPDVVINFAWNLKKDFEHKIQQYCPEATTMYPLEAERILNHGT